MAIPRCVCALVWMALLSSACAEEKKDPRETLEGAVAEGIRLLEAKEYLTMIKQFATPQELKEMGDNLEQIAKDFGEKEAANVLKLLKYIKDKKPQMSEENQRAEYKLPEGQFKKEEIVYKKIGKYWYIFR